MAEEDGGVPTLYDLSLAAMVKDNSVYDAIISLPRDRIWPHIDVSKLNLHSFLWYVHASTTHPIGDFSVIEVPKDFNIQFTHGKNFRQNCSISINYKEQLPFVWHFYPTIGQVKGYKFDMKIGKYTLPTVVRPGPTTTLHSRVRSSRKNENIFEILELLSKAFQYPVSKIEFDYLFESRQKLCFEQLTNWKLLLRAKSVRIGACSNADFLEHLLDGRYTRRLRTYVKALNVYNRIHLYVEPLLLLDFETASLNLQPLDFDDVFDFIQTNIERQEGNVDMDLSVWLWREENLEYFVTQLNLSEQKTRSSSIKKYFLERNGKEIMFELQLKGSRYVHNVKVKTWRPTRCTSRY